MRRKRDIIIFFPHFFMFDPMADLTGSPSQDDPTSISMSDEVHAQPRRSSVGANSAGGGEGGFGKEIHSITIRAKQRTFYIDLKESTNGKFFKVSEKSRGGRKTTIMFDSEDLGQIIDALNEMKTKLS